MWSQSFSALKNLYLYKKTSPIMESVDDDDDLEEYNDLEERKSTSVFERKLTLCHFGLTDKYLKIMKQFSISRKSLYIGRSRVLLEDWFGYVLEHFKNPFVMPSWRNPLDGDTFPKVLDI